MNQTARRSPADTGGEDATSRRSRAASFDGADEVDDNGTSSHKRILKQAVYHDNPVCAAAVASSLFVDGAATPPVSGGELLARHSFTPSMAAPRIDFHVLHRPRFRREFFGYP